MTRHFFFAPEGCTYESLEGIGTLFLSSILAFVGGTAFLAGFGRHFYVWRAVGVGRGCESDGVFSRLQVRGVESSVATT
jgi:hypothetical protein